VAEPKSLLIEVRTSAPRRQFTPPAVPKAPLPPEPAALPPAPELAGPASNPQAALPKLPRKFVAPPKPQAQPVQPAVIAAPAPVIASAAALPADNSLVIAGLNPASSPEVPAPPGSIHSSFSGGPKAQPKGSDSAPSSGMLEIPSLTVQGGAGNPQPPVMVARLSPTSPEALAAALRAAHGGAPPAGASPHQVVRVANAPDPRMVGRQVYTMAIQVPNLTSYTGSWLVWFAGRDPETGGPAVDMRPPLPLRMVDPKYIAAAADERVEGKVRLWAVIGRDGHISGVALLQHLDDRLDHSAEEALGKWLFQPAQRNGLPVDVDAVFEIPFYLAPKNQQ
jgi:TonB family protein